MSMLQGGKEYLATVDSIEHAAILSDLLTIQNRGVKARTNYNYTKRELLALFSMDSLLQVREPMS